MCLFLCPAVPSAQCFIARPHRKQVLCSRLALHGQLLPCRPLTLVVGHGKNRILSSLLPISFVRHEVSVSALHMAFRRKTLLSQSKGQSWRAAFHFVSSTPQPWDWAGHKCGQHRGKRLTSESVWTSVSTVFMRPGARRDQEYKLSEYQALENNRFPKEDWHASASSLLHRNGL